VKGLKHYLYMSVLKEYICIAICENNFNCLIVYGMNVAYRLIVHFFLTNLYSLIN
jgi:hypothetical protein